MAQKHLAKTGLHDADFAEARISNEYQTASTGTTHIYFQQVYAERDIFNAITNMNIRNGKVLSVGDRFVKNVAAKINVDSPTLTPAQALLRACQHIDINITQAPTIIETTNLNRGGIKKILFNKAYISLENIPVEAKWQLDNNQTLRLVWEVRIYTMDAAHWWNIRVDALTGEIVDMNDWVVNCKFHHDKSDEPCTHDRHETAEKEITSNDIHRKVENIVTNTYNVFPFPIEAPSFGAQTTVSTPWASFGGTGPGATNGWHHTAATNFTYTRGNNVFAYLDVANDNAGAPADAASSTSGASLDFPFVFDAAQLPTTTTNRDVAVTNLFYWNNVIHDILNNYGFDEASGNFQESNTSGSGLGSDYVRAEAQDGSGSNNANFATPDDGTPPRMQMYLWTGPDRDGDLDNGIIVHEYGHGVSNRLTGGAASSGCLAVGEQMGEGWSDYLALMLITDWSTASESLARPIATYADGQATTGNGIRTQKYSTDLAVNNLTYSNVSTGGAHFIGEVWCSMLWDMTWALINAGAGKADIRTPGSAGNQIALQLVIDAMKLQPCNPGFVDGRDAIVLADEIRYGGAHICTILEAFRRRGLGMNAAQGDPASYSDGAADFTAPSGVVFDKRADNEYVIEGNVVSFTLEAKSRCQTENSVVITDVLPTGLTYTSSTGTFSGNTITSTTTNMSPTSTKTMTVNATVNTGIAAAPTDFLIDNASTMDAASGWTSQVSSGKQFSISGSFPHSGTGSWFITNYETTTNISLTNNTNFALPADHCIELIFWHSYNTENGWDGGRVEVSTNNGSSWTDVGSLMTQNGYNGTFGDGTNTKGFIGNSNGYIQTIVNLSSYAGQNLRIRFRFTADSNTAATGANIGWYIDDVTLTAYTGLINTGNITINGAAAGTDNVCIKILPSSLLATNLISFTGEPKETYNRLHWRTLQDVGVKNYTVERSINQREFVSIGSVVAIHDNTTASKQYNFNDNQPLDGVCYYRLKVNQFDGTYEYSDVIAIVRAADDISVYPNPAQHSLTVSYKSSNSTDATLKIIDPLGRVVQHTTHSVVVHNNNLSVDITNLPAGTYLLQIEQDNRTKSTRFIKE
ncbi:MAG: M36 family metallopeptidase [Saprospiraceae bacterium]|nr:M36 family metallopeptidase [Saprospiraceae bacterium]